jgi:hypothetical protein
VNNLRQHWQLTQQIVRDVGRRQPVRALLGHTPMQYMAASGACDARVRRCYGVHSPFEAELREGATSAPSVRQRVAWRGAAWVERRLLAASDIVHYDSSYTCHLMKELYPAATHGKGVVLPGWVDDTRFHPADVSREEVRRRLGAPWRSGVTTFFTLRRLFPRMGIDTLIEAAARLAEKDRTFRLVIGGDGLAELEGRPRAHRDRDFSARFPLVQPGRRGLFLCCPRACGAYSPCRRVRRAALARSGRSRSRTEFRRGLATDNVARGWPSGWTTSPVGCGRSDRAARRGRQIPNGDGRRAARAGALAG